MKHEIGLSKYKAFVYKRLRISLRCCTSEQALLVIGAGSDLKS